MVFLKSKETKKVVSEISPDKLAFYNGELKKIVESGTFKVMIGPDSADLTSVLLTVH